MTTQHSTAAVNGIDLHYAHAGAGPLIVFLHGFPQFHYAFRSQLEEFGGDRLAVAPDQRGYNLSSKPEGVHSYGVWPAVEDLRCLVEHLGYSRFVLVGHDWGSLVAWSFALHYPHMLDALVSLGGAHPGVLDCAQREDPEQIEASQYLLGLRRRDAIDAVQADDFAALEHALDHPFITAEDLAAYRRAWNVPRAVESALHWYEVEGIAPPDQHGTPARGNYCPDVAPQFVDVPTLVVYPEADPYVRPASHAGLDHFVRDLTFLPVKDGTHWIAEQHPELVNRTIREFLARLAED
ncbi:MAG TPA: alpha/beta hydrolase [Solirubrobacteraceae bacterium]|nr:alpha/beta hydrolase [Solirubrobacteraceae bacterium]